MTQVNRKSLDIFLSIALGAVRVREFITPTQQSQPALPRYDSPHCGAFCYRDGSIRGSM